MGDRPLQVMPAKWLIMRNAILLWVPKTAGTSICEWGAKHVTCRQVEVRSEPPPYDLDGPILVTFKHSSVARLITQGFICESVLANRHAFAFIRNPWARLVSLAAHSARKMTHLTTTQALDLYRKRLKGKRYALGTGSHRRINPQVDWLRTPRGDWIVDTIGQHECLDQHWGRMCGALEWPAEPLEQHNQSQHGPYQEYYDVELRDLVAEWYHEDIRLGDYAFEQPVGSGRLIEKRTTNAR